MNHHSVVRNFWLFGLWPFRFVKTVQVLQQVCQLANPCLLRPNTTKHVQSFLGLNFRLSKKTLSQHKHKKLNKQFLKPFVSQKGTSWNLSSFTVKYFSQPACLLQGPSLRPDLGDGDGKPTPDGVVIVSNTPWHRFQLSLVHFHPPNFLQFETHFPFIFVL